LKVSLVISPSSFDLVEESFSVGFASLFELMAGFHMLVILSSLFFTSRLSFSIDLLFLIFSALAVLSPLAGNCNQTRLLEVGQERDKLSVDMILRLRKDSLVLFLFSNFVSSSWCTLSCSFLGVSFWRCLLLTRLGSQLLLHVLLANTFTLL
jgi:hypothetical protein